MRLHKRLPHVQAADKREQHIINQWEQQGRAKYSSAWQGGMAGNIQAGYSRQ